MLDMDGSGQAVALVLRLSMANTFVIACGECEKQIKVSEDVIGKKIRCKECGNVFAVKKPKEPIAASKEAKAPPKDEAKPADVKSKNPFLDDDEEDGKEPYGIVIEDEGIARCPNCAKELQSKDAVICLHCGYNTVTRKRETSAAVYEATGEDKFHWWLPGILCCVGILVVVGLSIFFWTKTVSWMTDGWFYDEEKPEKPWIVKPGCFKFLNVMVSGFICFYLGRFAYRRLVLYNKPPEKAIEKQKDEET